MVIFFFPHFFHIYWLECFCKEDLSVLNPLFIQLCIHSSMDSQIFISLFRSQANPITYSVGQMVPVLAFGSSLGWLFCSNLDSANSPKSLGSFYWRMVLNIKIWAVAVLMCSWSVAAPSLSQNTFICTYSCVCVSSKTQVHTDTPLAAAQHLSVLSLPPFLICKLFPTVRNWL